MQLNNRRASAVVALEKTKEHFHPTKPVAPLVKKKSKPKRKVLKRATLEKPAVPRVEKSAADGQAATPKKRVTKKASAEQGGQEKPVRAKSKAVEQTEKKAKTTKGDAKESKPKAVRAKKSEQGTTEQAKAGRKKATEKLPSAEKPKTVVKRKRPIPVKKHSPSTIEAMNSGLY